MDRRLDLLNLLSKFRPQPFVAPIPSAEKVFVYTMQDGMPYRAEVVSPKAGWWKLTPKGSRAEISGPAEEWERLEYLSNLHKVRVIPTFQLDDTTWLVVPHATGPGVHQNEPKQMHLVVGTVTPLQVIIARSGTVLLYDEPDDRVDQAIHRRALKLLQEGKALAVGGNLYRAISIVRERLQQTVVKTEQETTEQQLRRSLSFSGANLLGWDQSGTAITVKWEYQGHSYRSTIRRNNELVSAGICLAGTEGRYDLSALPIVMAEAVRQNRYDLNRASVDFDPERDYVRDYDDDYDD